MVNPKKVIKKILNSTGYNIVKIRREENSLFSIMNSVRNTMKESLLFLCDNKGFTPDVIVDVGAADGTYSLLDVFPNAFYIWIEPLVEYEGALKKIKEKYRGFYKITAVGKTDGYIQLNVHPDRFGSSLYPESDGKIADGNLREIPIIKLDTLEELKQFSKNVLLKIDVQGAELDVLEGASDLIQKCEVIILEVSFFHFHINAPDLYEVIHYMKQKGFVVYDVVDGLNRPLDGALGQKDLFFVKEDGCFRTSNRWATDAWRTSYLKDVIEKHES